MKPRLVILYSVFCILYSVFCIPSWTEVILSEEDLSSYVLTSKTGKFGAEEGEFNYPKGLSLDKKGNVYVADSLNLRVQIFNRQGEFVRVVDLKDKASDLTELTGISLSSGGHLFVADRSGQVFKFSRDGKFLSQEEREEDLSDLAVASDETIYTIAHDRALWVDEEFVYVASYDRIVKLSRINLKPVLEFGSYGEEPGQFRCPGGICVDRYGYIYVADTLNDRIQKFTPKGEFITSFGEVKELKELSHPTGIVVTPLGELWISSTSGHQLVRLRPKSKMVLLPEIEESLNPEWTYNKARQFQTNHKLYPAITAYTKCLSLKPATSLASKAQLQVAKCWQALEKYEQAFLEYDLLLEKYPKSKEAKKALYEMGELSLKLGYKEEAKEFYTRLIKEYPRSLEALRAKKRLKP